MPEIMIRAMEEGDSVRVLAIYGEGIATGHATFQAEVPTWDVWDKGHLGVARLVAAKGGEVLGWAALSLVSARPVYAGVTEISIYVADKARGLGIGAQLMAALVEASEAAGIWTMQAGIFPENESSIALHERFGFRILGQREAVGRMRHGPLADQWRDVILMERRSKKTGQG